MVDESEPLATVGDPAGDESVLVRAPRGGVVIGRTQLPIVSEGDALFHVARLDPDEEFTERIDAFQAELGAPAFFDPEDGPQSMGD